MGSEPAALREMTLDEWAALPEDEPGELVNGRIEEEETADDVHLPGSPPPPGRATLQRQPPDIAVEVVSRL
jgi:hypothetical protein